MANGGVRVCVMYGTQTGNSRGVATQLGEVLVESGFDAQVASLDQFKKLEVEKEQFLVIVCSTTGNGDAPENAEAFVRFVKSKRAPAGHFAAVRYAVLGIGDTNYDQYQAIPRLIDVHLDKLGARRLLPLTEADEAMGLEGTVEPWIPRIVDALRALATAAQSGEATPTASVAATTVPAPVAAAAAPDADAGADPDADPDADAALDAAAAEEWAMHEGGSALRPHDARVLAAEWLTVDEDGRRVMTLTLDLSRCEGPSLRGLTPGDALAVTPHNDSGDVAAVLDALGVNPGEARQPLALGADAERPAHLRTVDSDPEPLSLERLLTERCDIGSAAGWPRPALLRVLAEAATEASEAAALQALTRRAPGAHRPSLAELLANYPSARPPLVRLVNALPPLAERLYSLASASTDGSARIVFTAVVYAVRDATGALVSRRGLCSGMLAAKGAEFLKSGGWLRPCVRVYRRRPTGNELRLPAALSAPLLMVGPGTGVAPFLSFLQHRAALIAAALQPPAEPAARGAAGAVGAAAVVGESHLFFGCQHQVGDFLFSKELREMERAGTLTRLHTAFSRDSLDSASAGEWRSVRLNVNYVQDLFLRSAALIQSLLVEGNAHLYVCGDGRSMAADVHRELVAVLQAGAKPAARNAVEAEAILSRLAKAGRYTREIWYG